jgi:hypothetical protein
LIAKIIGHKFSDYLGQIEEFPLYTDLEIIREAARVAASPKKTISEWILINRIFCLCQPAEDLIFSHRFSQTDKEQV